MFITQNGMNNNNKNFDEVAPSIIESIKLAKQALILEKSSLTIEHFVSNELLENSNLDLDGRIKHDLRHKLSNELIGLTQEHLEIEDYRDGKLYKLDLFVASKPELKHIVEYCIKHISIEEIIKIKERK